MLTLYDAGEKKKEKKKTSSPKTLTKKKKKKRGEVHTYLYNINTRK